MLHRQQMKRAHLAASPSSALRYLGTPSLRSIHVLSAASHKLRSATLAKPPLFQTILPSATVKARPTPLFSSYSIPSSTTLLAPSTPARRAIHHHASSSSSFVALLPSSTAVSRYSIRSLRRQIRLIHTTMPKKASNQEKGHIEDHGKQPSSSPSSHTHSHSAEANTHSHSHAEQQHSHSNAEHSHAHDEHSHSLFGHSHSHSSADSVFVQEHGGLKNPAIRITWVGLLANLSMAIGKGIGGVVFHSQALLADSIHALSDLISDFLTLATVSVAARPSTADFPNGYGKIETLGSLGVSAMLFLAGISMGWSGLISILQQLLGENYFLDLITQFVGHGHSHSHIGTISDTTAAVAESAAHSHSHSHSDVGGAVAHGAPSVDLNAMWLALGSVAIKEWLFHATMKVANSTGSSVLVANAWHHRIDSLTSIVAVATIGGSYMFGLNWLDALGGLLVSCVIIRAGYQNGYAAALELADSSRTVPVEIIDSNTQAVKTALTRAVADGTMKMDDFDINNILVMSSGPNYVTLVELKTAPTMAVNQTVNVSRFVEEELLAHDPRLKRVTVKYIDTDTIRKELSAQKEKHI